MPSTVHKVAQGSASAALRRQFCDGQHEGKACSITSRRRLKRSVPMLKTCCSGNEKGWTIKRTYLLFSELQTPEHHQHLIPDRLQCLKIQMYTRFSKHSAQHHDTVVHAEGKRVGRFANSMCFRGQTVHVSSSVKSALIFWRFARFSAI